jgi:hypothetical protein
MYHSNAATRHFTFYISMTNGSTLLDATYTYFNSFIVQLFVHSVQLFEWERVQEKHYFLENGSWNIGTLKVLAFELWKLLKYGEWKRK